MILDRLKAQPELMEALGVQWNFNRNAFTIGNDVFTVDLADDERAGSALLLVRCMRWLRENGHRPRLISSGQMVPVPGREYISEYRPTGFACTAFYAKPHVTKDSTGSTMVEACLLAVLEVAEGK
jgi:hypothetical protein